MKIPIAFLMGFLLILVASNQSNTLVNNKEKKQIEMVKNLHDNASMLSVPYDQSILQNHAVIF